MKIKAGSSCTSSWLKPRLLKSTRRAESSFPTAEKSHTAGRRPGSRGPWACFTGWKSGILPNGVAISSSMMSNLKKTLGRCSIFSRSHITVPGRSKRPSDFFSKHLRILPVPSPDLPQYVLKNSRGGPARLTGVSIDLGSKISRKTAIDASLISRTKRKSSPGVTDAFVHAPPFSLTRNALSITLPIPPSINRQYATVNGRRVLSATGRRYKGDVRAIAHDCRLFLRVARLSACGTRTLPDPDDPFLLSNPVTTRSLTVGSKSLKTPYVKP